MGKTVFERGREYTGYVGRRACRGRQDRGGAVRRPPGSLWKALGAVLFASVLLNACATAPPPAKNPQVEMKLVQANRDLDALNERINSFYGELGALKADVAKLYEQPRWEEMKEIILATPSMQDPESDPRAEFEASPALAAWKGKQDKAWEALFERYQALADRCTILEAKRVSMLEKLLAAQAKYIGATLLEANAGRYEQGKAIYAVVEILGRTQNELESYTLNPIGLYNPGAGR